MRQSVGATTTFKAALIFTLIFAGFLSLAITYNRAFKLKNESLDIIEKYEGISNKGAYRKAVNIINNYLDLSGYRSKGYCDTKKHEYGVTDLKNGTLEKAEENVLYYYCISSKGKTDSPDGKQIYYNFKLFFKFNLPVFGELMNFKVSGKTKGIRLYSPDQLLQ